MRRTLGPSERRVLPISRCSSPVGRNSLRCGNRTGRNISRARPARRPDRRQPVAVHSLRVWKTALARPRYRRRRSAALAGGDMASWRGGPVPRHWRLVATRRLWLRGWRHSGRKRSASDRRSLLAAGGGRFRRLDSRQADSPGGHPRSPACCISRSVAAYASATHSVILSGSGEYSNSIDIAPSMLRALISRR